VPKLPKFETRVASRSVIRHGGPAAGYSRKIHRKDENFFAANLR
jgi:hypothetical protein